MFTFLSSEKTEKTGKTNGLHIFHLEIHSENQIIVTLHLKQTGFGLSEIWF